MRSLLLLLALPATAVAENATLPVLDVRALPMECRDLATGAAPGRPRVTAYVSAANCMAMVRLHGVKVSPTPASRDAIDAAIRPSLALLDAVIQTGDAQARIYAQYAKADLYGGAGVSLLAAVAPAITGPAVALHDTTLADAVKLVQPWQEHARDAYLEVERLGAYNPELVERDPVIAFEVRISRAAPMTGIATR